MHVRLQPQRFRYLRDGVRGFLYGVLIEQKIGDDEFVFVVAYIDGGEGFFCCDCDSDPTPHIRKRLGDATDFEWLDHDGGWHDE